MLDPRAGKSEKRLDDETAAPVTVEKRHEFGLLSISLSRPRVIGEPPKRAKLAIGTRFPTGKGSCHPGGRARTIASRDAHVAGRWNSCRPLQALQTAARRSRHRPVGPYSSPNPPFRPLLACADHAMASAAAILLAAVVAAAALPAARAAEAPGFLESLGTGAPGAVNCTPLGALAGQWIETTQVCVMGSRSERRPKPLLAAQHACIAFSWAQPSPGAAGKRRRSDTPHTVTATPSFFPILCVQLLNYSQYKSLAVGAQALVSSLAAAGRRRLGPGSATAMPCAGARAAFLQRSLCASAVPTGAAVRIIRSLHNRNCAFLQGEDVSGMPDPLPFPWSLSAEDTRAPGFYAT